jgi:hypothetical protein
MMTMSRTCALVSAESKVDESEATIYRRHARKLADG